MKQKYRFNMVEIALAIVIIAIGLSSVLVLFPIGINATRAAVEESLAPEVSEHVVHYIRTRFLKKWKDSPGEGNFDFFSNNFNEIKDVKPEDAGKEENWKPSDEDEYLKEDKNGKKGLYKYSKNNADGETFSAIVKIWSSSSEGGSYKNDLMESGANNCLLYIPDVYGLPEQPQATAKAIKYDDGSGKAPGDRPTLEPLFDQFAKSVLVEISWPVESPETERNKRTFRVDVYNPHHRIQQ